MHEKYHFLGAYPDGLVTCLCYKSSLLQIKCPGKHKDNLSISDCIAKDKEFCLDKDCLLKLPHKHYAQVQMQMYLYGLKVCHFVIWTPMSCAGVLVPQDDSFTKNVPVLAEFHKKDFARELITRAIENTQDKYQGEESLKYFVTAKHHMMTVNHMLVVMIYTVIIS